MKLASYNIRKAVGLDWRRDPARIVAVLAEIGADIVALQEADKRLGPRPGVLSEELIAEAGYHFAEMGGSAVSHGWHGNAILLRAGLHAEKTTRIPLPALEPRGAVSARLDSGLTVIGAHLSLAPKIRLSQIRRLTRRMTESGRPAILAGDFNEWRELSLPGVEILNPGKSFHAARPMMALDRFVLAGGVRAERAYVHGSALARRASDHLPVVLDFEVSA